MGYINENHGRFAIEGRRESFYIHANYINADYGYVPLTCELSDVKVGACFRDSVDSPPFQVIGQLIGKTLVKPAFAADAGPGRERKPTDVVIRTYDGPEFIPVEVIEGDHPLGQAWRECPHPEFEIVDLDDLISALTDYREQLAGGNT